jgi:hypothetical protein
MDQKNWFTLDLWVPSNFADVNANARRTISKKVCARGSRGRSKSERHQQEAVNPSSIQAGHGLTL